ncbi:MAG: TonB-dependent receptor [Balneolaceae bacterium]
MKKKLHLLTLLITTLLSGSAFAQVGSLSGVVQDVNTGETLPGANIYIVELGRGAATNVNGEYSILAIPVGTYTFRVTYVGYSELKETIVIGASDVVKDFDLKNDFLGLEELVVTGVGSETSTRKLAINVESVSSEKLETVPVSSIDAALTGKIAGAQIINQGQPGSGASIILRGINTFGSTNPIILLDGIEISSGVTATDANQGSSRLADIDWTTIDRVEVVKGAAAATLYGAQGANGVIQLFTKKGTPGQTRVTFQTTQRFDEFLRGGVEFADKHAYATDANGNISGVAYDPVNFYWTQETQRLDPAALVDQPFQVGGVIIPTFDNLDRIMQTGRYEQYALNVSGGDEKSNYLISAGSVNQSGVEEEVNYWRNNFGLRYGINLRDDLKIDAKIDIINSRNKNNTESGNNVESGLNTALTTPVYQDMTLRDDEGYFLAALEDGDVSANPLFMKQINTKDLETVRFINNVNLNYKPIAQFELDYRFGVDHYRSRYNELQINSENIQPVNSPVLAKTGYIENDNISSSRFNSILNGFLRFDFERDFGIDAPILTSTQVSFDWRKNLYQRLTADGNDLPTLPLETLDAVATPSVDEFRSEFITYGYLINQKVDYGDLLGFSFGGRYDRSSAFGEGERTEFFPRGDFYFRISDLATFEPLKDNVSDLKFRVAYGEAGTQPSAFDRITTLSQGLLGTSGTLNSQTQLNNPQLGVEVSKEFEIGGDVVFNLGDTWFQSIKVGYTYYDRINDFVIRGVEVAPSTGASTILTNAFKLDANGMDIEIDALMHYSRDFNWTSTITFGQQETFVTDISNGEAITINVESGQLFYFNEGDPFGAHFGFAALSSFDEVDSGGNRYIPEGSEGMYSIVDGRVVENATRAVQYRSEQEIIGDPTPDFIVGFRNDFNIKNLRVAMQWDWVQGGEIYNATRQRMYQDFTHADVTESISLTNGDQGAFANYYWSQYNGNLKNDSFIEDGTFLKLRELSLSYDLATLINTGDKSFVKNFIVSLGGRNLLTFTKYTGFDPEVTEGGQTASIRGYDYFTYPNFRSYNFGVKVTF